MQFLTYTNPNYGVEINYPMDWDIMENYMGTVAIFLSPQENPNDDFRDNANIVVQDLSGMSMDLEQYNSLSMTQLQQLITKFKVIEPISITMLAGIPACRIKYQGKQGKLKLQWYSIWTIMDNAAYVVTCTAKQDSYNKYLPIFNEMISSFRIL